MSVPTLLVRIASVALAVTFVTALGHRALAQQSGGGQVPAAAEAQAAPATRTTAAGVYTAEQAKRGEQSFSNNCVGCHTRDAYTATGFRNAWNGKPVAELFLLIRETMPEDFPGALAPREYADLLAFMLQLNRQPAGDQELPADAAALKTITLDLSQSSTVAR